MNQHVARQFPQNLATCALSPLIPAFILPHFFPAFTFAHLARCAAAIFLRPAAEMVCLPRFAEIGTTLCALALAHRARCALAILRREAADTMWVARVDLRDAPEPFKDSITEIAWSNFPTTNCVLLRSSRSC